MRALITANEVYDRGAPIPTVTASPDQNRFLRDVRIGYRCLRSVAHAWLTVGG